MSRPLAVLCLAAGLGKRTRVSIPKAVLPLCGRALAEWSLDASSDLKPERTVVVVHHHKERVMEILGRRGGVEFVDQGEPRGTGHAVKVAMNALSGFEGDILVTYADCPLLTARTLRCLKEARGDAPCSLLTATLEDPHGLGRILRNEKGDLVGIREQRDCSEEEDEIREINAGFYCFDAAALRPALERLEPDNAQRELYLTDVVAGFVEEGREVVTVETEDLDEVLGVNSLADLAMARTVAQERILLHHLENGVLIEDPATTAIGYGVRIGPDTRVLPFTVIESGVEIGRGCEVGPFAHLRPGTVLDDGAEVGNFVETKKARLGRGAKAKHLTYLGDARVGERANIGAGTITANYDGERKHETVVGARAFVGSGTVLVAPAVMGDGSRTGAGAIVTRNSRIGQGETWVGVPARLLRRSGGSERTP
ncbi:MAG: bifunctional UDP-N-acetylglucosamine diphosphorylase/glucosamine-1-phosphate N-acetyltransferase GlmU [Planctomycetota bacterium]